VVSGDGELIELRHDKSAIIDPAAVAAAQRKFYSELRYIANSRGYRSGWIAHQFKTKYGHWPNGFEYVPPTPPSGETIRWVKSRQIAYAKAKMAVQR
jgi:hypothetical protein